MVTRRRQSANEDIRTIDRATQSTIAANCSTAIARLRLFRRPSSRNSSPRFIDGRANFVFVFPDCTSPPSDCNDLQNSCASIILARTKYPFNYRQIPYNICRKGYATKLPLAQSCLISIPKTYGESYRASPPPLAPPQNCPVAVNLFIATVERFIPWKNYLRRPPPQHADRDSKTPARASHYLFTSK